MRLKIALVAVFALVLQARAVSVSPSEAASAARGWAASGEHLGIDFAAGTVETTAVHAVSNGRIFYAVKLKGRGTVFMSGDTEIEPVISFTGSLADYSSRDNGPFWALMYGDAACRKPTDGAFAKWSRFWAADPEKRPRLLKAAPLTDPPSDLRVEPLVKSKWNQDYDHSGNPVFNYYTPSNYVCGCVATMTAQIMRYLHGPVDNGGLGIPFPLEEVKAKSFDCLVSGIVKKLTMQGGTYAWDNMPLTVGEIEDDEQRQNIGKLTSDIGISVNMAYGKDGSGASTGNAVTSLIETFGYKQGYFMYINVNGDHQYWAKPEAETWQKAIYANLDAKRPCMLSIHETGADAGHAVVADGYGFEGEGEESVPYVHLNMGWGGFEDYWYNLPDMGDFDVVNGIGYNIFPDVGGIDSGIVELAIISGRTLNHDGDPVAGANITAYRAGTSDVVTNAVSDSRGVWAVVVPGGLQYDIEATDAAGTGVGEAPGVYAERPLSNFYGGNYTVGNSWGNDVVLGDPLVDVGGSPFASLDRAIAAGRKIAGETGGQVEIKILSSNAVFKADSAIDYDCVIFATNSAPYESFVARTNDACLCVATNGTLVLSNIVFSAGEGTLVDVASNGVLRIADVVDFGVEYDVAAVTTANADCFELLRAVTKDFSLSCASAQGEGGVFGHCSPETKSQFDAMSACAPLIGNFDDADGDLRAAVQGDASPYDLVWLVQQPPLSSAVAYYVDSEGVTNTSGRIDVMLDRLVSAIDNGETPEDIVAGILRRGTLSRPYSVGSGSLTIAGAGVPVIVEEGAGFTVSGGSLSVGGLDFSGYRGNAFFMVNGDDATLDLSGVTFAGFEGTNKWSGAVTVLNGSARISDSAFSGCAASGKYAAAKNVMSFGGAVYAAAGCDVALDGCTITNCWAANNGGAVYAAAGATVSVSGEAAVWGNTSGSGNAEKADDVYLKNTKAGKATLLVAGEVSGVVGVRWEGEGANGFGNTDGLFFAEAEDASVAEASAACFVSDVAVDDVVAEAVESDGVAMLRWTAAPEGPQPIPVDPDTGLPLETALAFTVDAEGVTNYYATVADALVAAPDGATVVVAESQSLESDIEISEKAITLCSGYGTLVLTRSADCSIIVESGASLTMSNITFRSSDYVEYSDVRMTKPLFDVSGGSLTMLSDAMIRGVTGDNARNAGAVSVWNGGTFTMESGAMITSCRNLYESASDGAGRGGGVLVDDGKAVFRGGTVIGCSAYTGGGVFVGNKGEIEVSGDTYIDSNSANVGPNLVVYDKGSLVLAGALSEGASIGYMEGNSGNTNVFATVAEGVSDADALSSAHRFRHDDGSYDTGLAVKNADGTLLVWSEALAEDGTYEGGELISDESVDPLKAAVPYVYSGLIYDGTEQTGVVSRKGYTLSGDYAATNAAEYTATATLRPGYAWPDGSTEPSNLVWTISKAVYDMSDVVFTNKTYTYTGNYFEMTVEGTLPDGVEVSYSENYRQKAPGEYEVTASFSGDADNYEAIDDMVATMTIVDTVPPSWPGEDDPDDPADVAVPVAISFAGLDSAEGTWTVTITAAVEKCWYELYETNSLSGGFVIDGVDCVARRQATADDVPEMKFSRTSDGEALFWKAKAYPEDEFSEGDAIP